MKILCATDFSEAGQAAEQQALELAGALGAELVYVHVSAEAMLYRGVAFAVTDAQRVYDAQRRWAEDTLAARVAAAGQRGVPARSVLRVGVPFDQIVDAARDERADMLVLGTHGRTGLDRLLMGSVAERVVRLAPCPVLTVRPRITEPQTLKRTA
ncbi:MAG: universal stress protein [Candidatus Rokubacteria bacterium]|nr:universal stress protein [Candidatus Rokubacteria bacterium]